MSNRPFPVGVRHSQLHRRTVWGCSAVISAEDRSRLAADLQARLPIGSAGRAYMSRQHFNHLYSSFSDVDLTRELYNEVQLPMPEWFVRRYAFYFFEGPQKSTQLTASL